MYIQNYISCIYTCACIRLSIFMICNNRVQSALLPYKMEVLIEFTSEYHEDLIESFRWAVMVKHSTCDVIALLYPITQITRQFDNSIPWYWQQDNGIASYLSFITLLRINGETVWADNWALWASAVISYDIRWQQATKYIAETKFCILNLYHYWFISCLCTFGQQSLFQWNILELCIALQPVIREAKWMYYTKSQNMFTLVYLLLRCSEQCTRLV